MKAKAVTTEQIDNARRSFLSASAIFATTSVLKAQEKKVDGGLATIEDKKIPNRENPIYPPGALSARNFAQHCTACQLCVSVCPNQVLRPSDNLMTLMQPEMSYERGYCRPECAKCAEVCPTDAIHLTSLAEKSAIQIGHAAFATKYFPDITADVAVRHYLKNDWEIGAHVGYRRVAAYTKRYEWNDEFFAGGTGDNGYLFTGWNESKTNLLTVGGELAKTIEVVRLNTKIDMHFFNSNFYYNAQIGAKYFPANDGKTNINAMASIGSAPETAVLDYALPGSFSHTNTMVGLGGQYMVSPNITIGLMGTWNTYYNQTNTVRGSSPLNPIESISTRYKNLYNIYAQVYISF